MKQFTAASRIEPAAIVLAALIPAAFYTFGLGLYTDDWGCRWALHSSPDQSWTGLYRTLAAQPALAVRPLQILWLIASHKLAAGSILVPHIANQLLFAGAGLLLWSGLRRLARVRSSAFALVLAYLCLPTYMTARFWWANHQAGIGLLGFAATVALLAYARKGKRRTAALPGALATALATILSYELFAFILLLVPLLLELGDGAALRQAVRDRRTVRVTIALLLVLAAGSAFKLAVGYGAALPSEGGGFVRDAAWLYARAVFTAFWTHGLAAPYYALRIAVGLYGGWAGPLAALSVVAVAAATMMTGRRAEPPAEPPAGPPIGLPLVAAGLAVFAFGYIPFLANFWFGGSPFGTANRAHVAGALGAAMVFVGLLNLALARRPGWWWAVLLTYCAAGVSTQVSVGRIWGSAFDEQERIAREIMTRGAPLPSGGAVMLYGHCPYYGPVPLFPPNSWVGQRLDMTGAAHDLDGDTIVPGTRAVDDGIELRDANHVGDLPPGGLFPYGDLVIYDLRAHRRHAIRNRAEAEAFFASHPASEATGCTYRGQAGLPLF